MPREDLPGAVALASVQMNLSRVIGPIIGAAIYYALDAAPVFAINALTYVFAVIGLLWAMYPRRTHAQVAERGFARLLSGVRIARRDPLLSHILVTLFSFSFFSLTFVGLMPVIAEESFDIGPKSWQYGVLYACFGLGAALGAMSVGTVFAPVSKAKLLRPAFVAFAVVLAGVRAAAHPGALVSGRAPARLRVLRRDHVAVDADPGAPRRRRTRTGHGAVDHGVRGDRAGRRARRRVGRQRDLDHRGASLAGAVWALVLAAWSNAESLRAKGASDV